MVRRTRSSEVPATGDAVTAGAEVARYARCAGFAGLEIVTARWQAHAFAPHVHDFYAVSLNDAGRGAFEWRRELRDAAPGTCNLIAPGEVHTGAATSADGWHYRNLHIERELMSALLTDLEWRGPADVRFASPIVDDPALAARLARALASLTRPSSRLARESLLLEVAVQLARSHLLDGRAPGGVGREPAAVARTRAWLDAHVAEDVSIRALARMVGLSPHYLVRAFRRHVGMPPRRYQTVMRVLHARRLLHAGVAIAEVAYRCGFCDQSHLNRCFKHVLGTTPGRYAAAG